MRALIQRVRRASVTVDGAVTGAIDQGLLVLLGVTTSDDASLAARLAAKTARLRIFPDEAGVMNRSVVDHGGAVLAVSQFTLYGDTRRGNRPSYVNAAPGEIAEPIYKGYCESLRAEGLRVEEGIFGADMDVNLINWGPVTILLESEG